jgi:phage major head subunit gpT-like protein
MNRFHAQLRAARRSSAEASVSLAKRRAWYATPMIEENFTSLTNLALGMKTIFDDQLTSVNELGQDLFSLYDVQTSDQAAEYAQGVGGFGDVPVYTGTLEYAAFEMLYAKTFTPVEYALGTAVERKLIDDAQYGVINARASKLGLTFDRKRYRDAASIFNNATSTVAPYVMPDGKALVAIDHPLSPTNAGTQSNAGSTALSYDAIIAAEQAGMAFTDSKGNPGDTNFDTLVVPLALRQTAINLVGSELRPGTANNDMNTLRGYNVVVSKYLTDSNNWFLVDSRLAKMELIWFNRIMPEFTTDPSSDYNLVSKFRGYMRYSYGAVDWRWIYGSIVA